MPLADHPERLGYAIWDQALNEEHHPGGETDSAPSSPDEKQISTALRRQLERLALANRCIWRAEVLLEFWTHATNAKMQRGRVDYLACLDDGPLIGFEVKRRPEQAADLGRFWLQAHDYARSIIVPHPALPPGWAKRPVFAVFLALDMREMKEGVANHLESCDRLFGPTRVGFVTHTGENRPLAGPPGLKLWLTGDKWWTERNGYRANAQRTVRSGNGTISVDFENVS